jgi:hypothetical protein
MMPMAILVGLVVIVFLVIATRSEASPRPVAPSDNIGKFASAIAVAEGYGTPGAIPTRARNPGDLNLGPPTLAGTTITVFESEADGWNALYAQLVKIRDGRSANFQASMSIAEMASVYAPSEPDAWAANVARTLGVTTDTIVGTLL